MMMRCNVNFIFSDDSLPVFIKNQVRNDYMCLREEAVGLLNPHFEEWNNAYTEPVNGENDMKYNAYISSKQNEILDKFNNENPNELVKLYADEYGDIAGKFQLLDKEYTVHMTLMPI